MSDQLSLFEVPDGRAVPDAGASASGSARSGGGVRRVRVSGGLYRGRVPDGAVYVGRAVPGLPGSPWANPHRVGWCRGCGAEHDRWSAVAAYAAGLAVAPGRVAAAREVLPGVDLACWCRVDEGPCHADVLALVVTGSDPAAAWAAVAARWRARG